MRSYDIHRRNNREIHSENRTWRTIPLTGWLPGTMWALLLQIRLFDDLYYTTEISQVDFSFGYRLQSPVGKNNSVSLWDDQQYWLHKDDSCLYNCKRLMVPSRGDETLYLARLICIYSALRSSAWHRCSHTHLYLVLSVSQFANIAISISHSPQIINCDSSAWQLAVHEIPIRLRPPPPPYPLLLE